MIAAIQILQSMGYVVTLEGDQIVLEYGGDAVPDAAVVAPLAEEIRQHKSAVIALLNTNPHFQWEPVENADTSNQQIPGEFFTNQADACYACGKSEWWDKAGQSICGICHPQPNQPHMSE